MKDTFTTDNRRDFQQRYLHCFAWYIPEVGEKQLVKIAQVRDEYVRFDTEAGYSYTAAIDKGVSWEFTQLERGWYTSSDGGAYYVSRIPQRQFARGISNANTQIVKLTDRMRAQDVTFENVRDICSNLTAKDQNIVVLSKHFAMNKKDVYMYDRVVGTRNKNAITVTNKLFNQELRDAVARSGTAFEVQYVV
jgi:hypothetical protein